MFKMLGQEYTAEFKELAVKRVRNGQGLAAVAGELGLIERIRHPSCASALSRDCDRPQRLRAAADRGAFACRRAVEVQLVNVAHQPQVVVRSPMRALEDRRAREVQQPRLTHNRQRLAGIDHRLALAHRRCGQARRQAKAISSGCWPILVWGALKSGTALRLFAVVTKISAARFINSARHSPIWLQWTLNCSASSTRVFSPRILA